MKKLFGMVVLALSLMACGNGGQKSEQLVVYTNSGTNGRSEYLVEEAKKAGFDISVVAAGGTDISNRLQAEKNSPIADVVFGLNAIEYEKLKKLDILEKFTPDWAGDIPEGLSDKEGFYNAVTQTPLIAAYNKEVVGNDIPTDWIQLITDSKFKNKFSILGLQGGTGKTVFASII